MREQDEKIFLSAQENFFRKRFALFVLLRRNQRESLINRRNNMNAVLTLTRTHQKMGDYKPTSVDSRKSSAQILIKYANGGSLTIDTKGM